MLDNNSIRSKYWATTTFTYDIAAISQILSDLSTWCDGQNFQNKLSRIVGREQIKINIKTRRNVVFISAGANLTCGPRQVQ
jgi:hypothetical protein